MPATSATNTATLGGYSGSQKDKDLYSQQQQSGAGSAHSQGASHTSSQHTQGYNSHQTAAGYGGNNQGQARGNYNNAGYGELVSLLRVCMNVIVVLLPLSCPYRMARLLCMLAPYMIHASKPSASPACMLGGRQPKHTVGSCLLMCMGLS